MAILGKPIIGMDSKIVSPFFKPAENVAETSENNTPQIADTSSPGQNNASVVQTTSRGAVTHTAKANSSEGGVQNAVPSSNPISLGVTTPKPTENSYKQTGTPADRAMAVSSMQNYKPSINAQNPAATSQPTQVNTDKQQNPNQPHRLDINDYLSGNGDLGDFLKNYIEEEKAKQNDYKEQERKYKRDKIYASIGDSISALANVFFASKGAPNMFDPKNSMSEKMRERYDKMIAEKDKSRDNILKLAQLKESLRQNDNNVRLAVEQFNQNAENNAFSQKLQREQFDETKKHNQWQQQYEQDKQSFYEEATRKSQDLSERQLNQDAYMHNQSYNLEQRKFENELQKGLYPFALGNGEVVQIPANALNSPNIAYLFNMLPEAYRANVHGKQMLIKNDDGESVPVVDKNKQPVYEPPTTDQMLAAIGAYLNSNDPGVDAVRNQVRGLAKPSIGVPESDEDDFGVKPKKTKK